MPNPKEYSNEKDFMSACMRATKKEGNPHEQCVAQCLNMWKSKKESNDFVEHYFESKE
jgi:hypothetical protein